MNNTAKKAIEKELSYLKDNRFRYEHFGDGSPQTKQIIRELIRKHTKDIIELEEALQND